MMKNIIALKYGNYEKSPKKIICEIQCFTDIIAYIRYTKRRVRTRERKQWRGRCIRRCSIGNIFYKTVYGIRDSLGF